MRTILTVLVLTGAFIHAATIDALSQNGEYRLLKRLEDSRTEGKTRLYKTLSGTATPFSLGLPAVLYVKGLIDKNKNERKTALFALEGFAISQAVSFSMKAIVNRERPGERYSTLNPVRRPTNGSFPSGHTSEAFATATSIAIVCPKWYAIVPAYSWATMVGYSRLYLGVHYPTDVLAGALLGSGSSWISYRLNRWMRGEHKKKHGGHHS